MDLSVVEKWQHGPQVELFYDSLQRKLVFKKFNYIYSKGVDDFHSYPYLDLHDFSAMFKTCCFSPQENLIAFQRNKEDLEILLIDSYQHFVLQGKNRKILGYHWIKNSQFSDLVVIDNCGVEFFKISKPVLKVNSVKSYAMEIGHYWYLSTEGIIIVSLSPPKLGQFLSFFLNQNRGAKNFNGPKFSLDLLPCVTDKWTLPPVNVTSIVSISEIADKRSAHSLILTSLYGTNYLVHMHCIKGVLKVFSLGYEKIEEFKSYKLEPGDYGVRCIDNLLFAQNYSLQETYVFDVNSGKTDAKPFCLFFNSMKQTLPTISVKFRIYIEKPKLAAATSLLYDGKPMKNLSEYTTISNFGGEAIECAMPLDLSLVYVDNDICIDTKSGRCYKLQFNPLEVVSFHPDRIESALFLFRRTGCKNQGYEFLKTCIRKYTNLKEFAFFFDCINKNYKQALDKRTTSVRRSTSLSSRDMYSRRLSNNLEAELKAEEGVVLLYQSDLFSSFFQPVYEESQVKIEFQAAVLQEYIHSLVDQDIEILTSLQMLFARMIVRIGDFSRLSDYIFFQVLSDSYEIINLLVQLVPSYYGALQLAIDMLFRMRYSEKLIDTLLEKEFVYETLVLLTKVSYPKFDIRKLFAKCEEIKDEQMTLVVNQFIKEKSLL